MAIRRAPCYRGGVKEYTWVDLLLVSGVSLGIPVKSQAVADRLAEQIVARVLAEDDDPLLLPTYPWRRCGSGSLGGQACGAVGLAGVSPQTKGDRIW